MVEVNYVAIFLAAVISMVVGFLWYSPMLFGKSWMKLMGLSSQSLSKAQKEMGKWYAVSFIIAMVSAFVLSHVMTMSLDFFGLEKLQTGLTTAFWMWLGFVMPVQLTDQIFGAKKWMLFAINTGYQFVSLLGMAIVLAMF